MLQGTTPRQKEQRVMYMCSTPFADDDIFVQLRVRFKEVTKQTNKTQTIHHTPQSIRGPIQSNLYLFCFSNHFQDK